MYYIIREHERAKTKTQLVVDILKCIIYTETVVKKIHAKGRGEIVNNVQKRGGEIVNKIPSQF